MDTHPKFIDARKKTFNNRNAKKYRKAPGPDKPDCDVITIRTTLYIRQLPNGVVYCEEDTLPSKIEDAATRHGRLVAQLNELLVKLRQI